MNDIVTTDTLSAAIDKYIFGNSDRLLRENKHYIDLMSKRFNKISIIMKMVASNWFVHTYVVAKSIGLNVFVESLC